MARTISTANGATEEQTGQVEVVVEILHERCGKPIAKVVDGVLQVMCTRQGCRHEWVPLNDWIQAGNLTTSLGTTVYQLQQSSSISAPDPLADYRAIDGLVVLGDREIELAFRNLDGDNFGGLVDGWCRRIMTPVPYSPRQLTRLVRLCRTRKWCC